MSLAVVWKPVPNFWKGPSGYPTRAIVNHRIVGSLTSAYDKFRNVGYPEGKTSNASSTFGIGRVGGKVVVWQFVALDDSAWTNGDVREPSWSRILPGINPNLYTWTIEHEDGGYANRGVVDDEVWRASMALQVVLASGDPARIRAAGITFRNESVARDGAGIPTDATGFIDHHQIAGPNKPYCFRRWLDDPGFVEGSPSRRDRLLAALRGLPDTGVDSMPTRDFVPQLWRAQASGAELREQADLNAEVLATIPAGTPMFSVGETLDHRFREVVAQRPNEPERLYFARRSQIDPVEPTPRDPELLAGIQAVINARLAGKPAPSADCGPEIAKALNEVSANIDSAGDGLKAYAATLK